MTQLHEGIFKSGANIYMLYSFLKRLVLKFDEWEAYKLGLIDADGKVLKKRSDMTRDERENFSKFDVMILNLKKLLGKLPGGKTRLASFAGALFLLKEGQYMTEEEVSKLVRYDLILEKYMADAEVLMEEGVSGGVPANNMGSGNIAIKNDKESIIFKKTKALKRKKKPCKDA